MAHFLNRGQTFTIGDGSGPTEENTIQSFNGELYKYNQSFYVDIILASQAFAATAVTVTGNQEFEIPALTVDAFAHYKFEVGDSVVLTDNSTPEAEMFNAEIVSINFSTRVLTLRLTDPHEAHPNQTTTLLIGDVNRTTSRVDIGVDGTFADLVAHDVPFSEINSLSVGNIDVFNAAGIVEIDFLFDETTPADSEFRIFTNNTATGVSLSEAIRGEISAGRATLTFGFNSTRTSFVGLDAEKPLHVGSKNTNSTAIVLPITLPANLTIRAGEGIEDLFLIYKAQ